MNPLPRSAWVALTLLALTGGASAETADLAPGLQLSCDNTLTLFDGPDLSLRCAGNLSLQGLQSDVMLERTGSITLEAGGDLSLSGLSLTAASVSMTSFGRLALASDVKIFSPGGVVVLDASAPGANPPVSLEAGGDVRLGTNPLVVTAVPEPASGLLGLMGVALAWAVSRTTRRSKA